MISAVLGSSLLAMLRAFGRTAPRHLESIEPTAMSFDRDVPNHTHCLSTLWSSRLALSSSSQRSGLPIGSRKILSMQLACISAQFLVATSLQELEPTPLKSRALAAKVNS